MFQKNLWRFHPLPLGPWPSSVHVPHRSAGTVHDVRARADLLLVAALLRPPPPPLLTGLNTISTIDLYLLYP